MNSPQPPGSLPPLVVRPAIRQNCKVKMALSGPSGSGKTYTALALATTLGTRPLLADSERDSSLKYAPTVDGKGDGFVFAHMPSDGDFNPKKIPQIVQYAVASSYDVLVFDSLSHYWNGAGGFLECLDAHIKRNNMKDSHAAWKAITPMYRRIVDCLIDAPIHIIVTMRAKQDYSKENGKVTKLGMAPEMRDGFEYEMDLHGMLNVENELHFTKTRCSAVKDKVFTKPGAELAAILQAWCNTGAPAATVSP